MPGEHNAEARDHFALAARLAFLRACEDVSDG
jgi:hypothetical protein